MRNMFVIQRVANMSAEHRLPQTPAVEIIAQSHAISLLHKACCEKKRLRQISSNQPVKAKRVNLNTSAH